LISNAQIAELLDLTSLNTDDDIAKIILLCQKAQTPTKTVAAICVLPQFISVAKNLLAGSAIKIATVANFPKGDLPLDVVIADIKAAIAAGAQEVDVVFPYQEFLRSNKFYAYNFIRNCKHACGKNVLLKVILETGVLADEKVIAEVSKNLCYSGADFLKTSTGKVEVGATLAAVRVMLNTVKVMSIEMKRTIGVKVSGGVRTLAQATSYLDLAVEVMGDAWVSAEHFRFGVSQLWDEL
jgi:deoxyribose-phosphate aldolase